MKPTVLRRDTPEVPTLDALTADKTAQAFACAQQHDRAVALLEEARHIPKDDPDFPAAQERLADLEFAAAMTLAARQRADRALADARQRARQQIEATRSRSRAHLVEKLDAALTSALALNQELHAFDADTSALLEGATVEPLFWPKLTAESVAAWRTHARVP